MSASPSPTTPPLHTLAKISLISATILGALTVLLLSNALAWMGATLLKGWNGVMDFSASFPLTALWLSGMTVMLGFGTMVSRRTPLSWFKWAVTGLIVGILLLTALACSQMEQYTRAPGWGAEANLQMMELDHALWRGAKGAPECDTLAKPLPSDTPPLGPLIYTCEAGAGTAPRSARYVPRFLSQVDLNSLTSCSRCGVPAAATFQPKENRIALQWSGMDQAACEALVENLLGGANPNYENDWRRTITASRINGKPSTDADQCRRGTENRIDIDWQPAVLTSPTEIPTLF